MRHRIFIAINFPENIKKRLCDYQKKWIDLPCRWIKKENIHITLVFLGYLDDEELLKVLNITKEVASRHEPFSIRLTRILYGPPKKPPRMVWIEGEKNEELGKLQADLENSFQELPVNKEGRPYAPHITIGRLREWEFRKMEPEERPEINEEISLNFFVESIELMESELKKTGPEYIILGSMPLSEKTTI